MRALERVFGSRPARIGLSFCLDQRDAAAGHRRAGVRAADPDLPLIPLFSVLMAEAFSRFCGWAIAEAGVTANGQSLYEYIGSNTTLLLGSGEKGGDARDEA